jgi:predicted KAP-like P-loop ATPase
MTSIEPQTIISGDRPVEDPAQDLLGLAPFAQQIAQSITTMAPAEGFVVGIHGPWGSGKTTLLRFIEHYLKQKPRKQQPVIVHFNPWWFAGHEDLTRHFLGELRSTLSRWKTVSGSCQLTVHRMIK